MTLPNNEVTNHKANEWLLSSFQDEIDHFDMLLATTSKSEEQKREYKVDRARVIYHMNLCNGTARIQEAERHILIFAQLEAFEYCRGIDQAINAYVNELKMLCLIYQQDNGAVTKTQQW